MKTVKILCVVLSLVMALSLVACNNEANEKGNEEQQDNSNQELNDNENSEENESQNEVAEEIELEFYHKWIGPETKKVDLLIEEYTKENPNVQIENVAPGGDYAPAIGARMASDSIPDIFMSGTYQDAILYAPQSEILNDEEYWDQIDPAAHSSVEKDGDKIAAPVQSQSWGIIYNKDVFEEAGIEKLPNNLTELEEVCKKLQSKGITPFAAAHKTEWTIHQTLLFPLSIDFEKPLESFEKLNNGEILLKDQPQMEKITNFIEVYKKYLQDKPYSTEYDGANGMVAQGEAAMIVQGDWTEAVMRSVNEDVRLGFIHVPYSEDPQDSHIFIQPSIAIHVGKGGENVDESKKFLAWMITSDAAKKWFAQELIALTPNLEGMVPSEGDLLKSATELAKAEPEKISIWGEFSVPTPVHVAIEPIDAEYMGSRITKEEWITRTSEVWEEYANSPKD